MRRCQIRAGENAWIPVVVNLPSSLKMTAPRYQNIPASKIPLVELKNKTRVKVLAGTFQGIRGPVENIIADPEYFDIEMPEHAELVIPVAADHTVFLFSMKDRPVSMKI